MEQRTCPWCSGPVTRAGKRGPQPTYCSPLCKSRAAMSRMVTDGRYREQLAESSARKAAERAANARPCPYCGTLMTNPRRRQCGSADCERRFNNEHTATWLQAYKAETGQHYRYKYEHQHVCEACGKTWTSREPVTRFCSGICANSMRKYVKSCEACGAEWTADSLNARFCSARCRGVRAAETVAAARSQVVLHEGPRYSRYQRATALLAKARPSPPLRKRWYAGRCAECGVWFVHDQPATQTCTLRCSKRAAKFRRRAVERGAFVAPVSRIAVYERDSWTCQLCGGPVDRNATAPSPLAPSIDHIIALANGGTHEPANVQCAHFLCNSLKGAGDRLPVAV
jgi:hypothetical protein